MAALTDIPGGSWLDLERELACFICTEIVFQPLTLIDCFHTFCGSCLKEWFSHQYRKASSHSSSSSSSSSSSNPYTCPTCRSTVKDARRNAMVNTLLEKFLTAHPERQRSEEDRQEMMGVYKPGDNIMPKVEGRRRERRTRRDEDAIEARERLLIEEARERSLRDMRNTQANTQSSLQVPAPSTRGQQSRSRDREERRERRREQERQERRQRAQAAASERPHGDQTNDDQQTRESAPASAPATSPRHPEAVEARQRQQTVVHQASLTSLISPSDSGSGSNSAEEIHELMQEILAEGLGILRLDGLDVEALPENEQEALAERLVEAYRQRRRERNQRNNPSSENAIVGSSATDVQVSDGLQVNESRRHQRAESGTRNRRADTMPTHTSDGSTGERPRSSRTHPTDSSNTLPPTSSVVFTHRNRASSQGQRSDGSRQRSRQSSPVGRSTHSRSRSNADTTQRSQSQDQVNANMAMPNNANQQLTTDSKISHSTNVRTQINHQIEASGTSEESITGFTSHVLSSPAPRIVEPTRPDTRNSRPAGQTTANSMTRAVRRFSELYDEPSVSCFRCHRPDIQYEVYRHCEKCELDLCLQCYRMGRGCKHWYGFGHAAMAQFEAMRPASHEQIELPHTLLIGRQYNRPDQHSILRSKLAKDGTTVIPLQTSSNPAARFQEGRFCDRCESLANSCFWSCDYCNHGEWGFCRDCVNTHHCCTHPLLPSAHKSYVPTSPTLKVASDFISPTSSDLFSTNLRPSPGPSQPSSATSATSASAGPLPDFVNLVITTNCDICHQSISPSAYRFHCPSHPSPSTTNADAKGDYDICTPCYQNLVKTNRIKRDDGSAGWRKCPSGHRMIITTFLADNEGGQRRVVINDLVGGWKSPEEAMTDWTHELEARGEPGHSDMPPSPGPGSPDGTTARRLLRARTGSYPDPGSPTSASPYNSSSRFPPDGGTGLRGVAWWSYFPNDIDKGPNDLCFPSGAEIREVRINEEYPDWCGGVYAGDRGLLPASYLRI